MSGWTGAAAATAALPIENWGALKWTAKPKSQLKLKENEQNGAVASSVKKAEEGEQVRVTNGSGTHGEEESVLQLVSLPKPQQQSSGTPASAVEKPIVQIPVSAIASASATTKNDLSLALRPQTSVTVMQDGGANVSLELTSVRFAIPNVCFGYEQTEEAGRKVLVETQEEMKKYQSRLLGDGDGAVHGGADEQLLVMVAGKRREDERVVAVLDDITFSYPSGRYKLIVSNYALVLEDKKRAPTGASGVVASVPLADVVQLYLCDIPDSGAGEQEDEELAQYVVVILRNPLKIRTTTYNHLVISCPAGFALDETHPWRCQLETQEEIDRLLATLPHNQTTVKVERDGEGKVGIKNTFTPTMSGRVSEILIRVLKAVTGVTALGGLNKEYQTSRGHSVLRCLHHGAHGLLFVLQSALLFLHRPATRVLMSDIKHVEVDESEGGNATFQMVVYGKFGKRGGGTSADNKILFSALDKREKLALLSYLERKVTVRRIGLPMDDDDDDEEGEDNDTEDNEEESEDDDDDEDDGDDEESDDDLKRRKRSRSKREKHEKEKRHRHEKRHKKERD